MNEATHNDTAVAELPRLRIHHFFVLTTVFAVVKTVLLGISWLIRSWSPDAGIPEIGIGLALRSSVQSLSLSTCFGVALLGLAWQKRGISFPSQPGHWMAIYLAITWAYEIVLTILHIFHVAQAFGWESTIWVTRPMSLVFHCFAFALGVAAYLHERTRIWKLGWAAMALKSLFAFLLMLFYIGAKCVEWLLEVYWYNTQFDWQFFSFYWGPYASFLMMLPSYGLLAFLPVATIVDLRQHRLRHWSHWLVVVSTFISTAVVTVYYHSVF